MPDQSNCSEELNESHRSSEKIHLSLIVMTTVTFCCWFLLLLLRVHGIGKTYITVRLEQKTQTCTIIVNVSSS